MSTQPEVMDKVIAQCGGSVWGECEQFRKEDWQHEVANGDTVLGYWDWVVSTAEANGVPLSELSASPAAGLVSGALFEMRQEEGGSPFVVEVIGVMEFGGAPQVEFTSQGGGFVRRLPVERFREITSPHAGYTFKASRVGIEDDDVVFPCYLDGRRWNGWAMPYFTKEQGLALVGEMPDLVFDEVRNVFVWSPEGADDGPDVYGVTSIEVDGRSIEVYPIGSGFWVWEEIDEPEQKPAALESSGPSL